MFVAFTGEYDGNVDVYVIPSEGGEPRSLTWHPSSEQNIQINVKPCQEWRQIYQEIWRIEREFFYDPNLHGLDLQKAMKK
jgi:hypothetical protein